VDAQNGHPDSLGSAEIVHLTDSRPESRFQPHLNTLFSLHYFLSHFSFIRSMLFAISVWHATRTQSPGGSSSETPDGLEFDNCFENNPMSKRRQ
jgi:hypothetical protein